MGLWRAECRLDAAGRVLSIGPNAEELTRRRASAVRTKRRFPPTVEPLSVCFNSLLHAVEKAVCFSSEKNSCRILALPARRRPSTVFNGLPMLCWSFQVVYTDLSLALRFLYRRM